MYFICHLELAKRKFYVVVEVSFDVVCLSFVTAFLHFFSWLVMMESMCLASCEASASESCINVVLSMRWVRQSCTYWLYVAAHGPRPVSESWKRSDLLF